MKIFFKKLKNTSLSYKLPFLFTIILYFGSYGYLTYLLLQLTGVETLIRYILIGSFAFYGLIYILVSFIKMFQNRKGLFTFLTILTLIFSGIFGVASFAIRRIYSKIDQFTTSDTSTYTSVILTLKDMEFTSDSKIGMVTDEEDRTGYILPQEWIKKENITNEIEYKDSTIELLDALYNHELDAIFITKDYDVLYSGEEKYQNIVNETQIVKEYSKTMKTEESELLATTKSLTEPFTVLIMGVDSESTSGLDANAAFNGDTLMLITFNPKTLTATMLSIPRDVYVPIISASGNTKGYFKINSSAAGGTASTINTIENITDVEIDYFVKVNFHGVVDLVNELGGIDVDVEAPDYQYYIQSYGKGRLCEQDSNRNFQNMICMNTGWQHLDGEQALAYARNRHGYLESDFARNRHQQQIIEAVAKKLIQNANLKEFENLLDTISHNIATNMKTSQILSFYQSIKGMLMNALRGEEFISIQKTALTVYDLDIPGISTIGYYQGSMDAITKAMKENLGLLEVDDVKTFYYDYSEDYERNSKVIGQGIYSGRTLYPIPDFKGQTVSEAKGFASTHNLNLSIEYESNPNEIPGIILGQSVTPGTLTLQFNDFTIYVNDPNLEEPTEDPEEEDPHEPSEEDPNTGSETEDPEQNQGEEENTEHPEEEPIPGTPTIPQEPSTPEKDTPSDDPVSDENDNNEENAE